MLFLFLFPKCLPFVLIIQINDKSCKKSLSVCVCVCMFIYISKTRFVTKSEPQLLEMIGDKELTLCFFSPLFLD